ncbi:MAG: metallophosphatase domain-containing protein [Vulcanimicrobiota bacterium]
MRFVVLSDTHNLHDHVRVPEGDVLLFGGDMCSRGTLEEVARFGAFLAKLPHPHKVVIAGNHDWPFERSPKRAVQALGEVVYLQDEAVEIEGVKIYGSPWQPEFFSWAFNLPRGKPLKKVWSRIPEDTQVLLTHGPPHDILDRTFRREAVGCEALRERVEELPELRAHIFGHIHEAYGRYQSGQCTFFNASICDLAQRVAQNPPWVFEL